MSSTATIIISVGLAIYFDWALALVAFSFVPVTFISVYLVNLVINVPNDKKTLEAPGNVRAV